MCGHRVVRARVYISVGYCPGDGSDIKAEEKNKGDDIYALMSYLHIVVTVGMVVGSCLPGALLDTFALYSVWHFVSLIRFVWCDYPFYIFFKKTHKSD